MPSVQYSRRPVFSRFRYIYPGGMVEVPLGSYTSGYLSSSKAETVKRPKPVDLKALSSLTGLGTHTETALYFSQFSARTELGGGVSIEYIDMNPQDAGVGIGRQLFIPDPEWGGKLRLAIKDQKVNLAQTLAEYRQAQSMFVKNATTVIQFVRWLKRGQGSNPFAGNKNRVRRTSPTKRNEVSDRYLEYQFGVKPLINDIAGVCEEFELALQRPHYRTVSCTVKNEDRAERSPVNGYTGKKVLIKEEQKVTMKVKCIVLGESLAAQRLGFRNPLALGWELLPYSFVLDYFIGVGSWLNSFDVGPGIQQCYGTVSRRSRYWCETSLGGTALERQYTRSVFDGLPGIDSFPPWKPSLGFTRITNILALLSQLKR